MVTLAHGDREIKIEIEGTPDDARVTVDGRTFEVSREAAGIVRVGPTVAWTVAAGGSRWVFVGGRAYELTTAKPAAGRRGRGHHGALTAPMPATVRRIDVTIGQEVRRGDTLILLEAMKMELPVKATADGVVRAINCREGELVQPGVDLIDVEGR
jgi:3-methylcrotonyl-CoA carboxylase alpha subunit